MNRVLQKIAYQGLGIVPRSRPFVFGIGLSKTGTTSLDDALQMLGYNAIHFPPIITMQGADVKFDPPWWAYKYDAWTDMTPAVTFRDLWETFPNAKFVYTGREKSKWLRSCERHFTLAHAEARVRQGNLWVLDLVLAVYGSILYKEDTYSAAYDAHEKAVFELMGDSDRFLAMDITAGDGWEKLCPFLGRSALDAPFPFSNKQKPAT